MRFEIDLESLDIAVLAGVSVGAVLEVHLVAQGPYQAVVARAPTGVVGTLAGFRGLGTLIACIQNGNVYSATVLAKTSSTARVLVERTAP